MCKWKREDTIGQNRKSGLQPCLLYGKRFRPRVYYLINISHFCFLSVSCPDVQTSLIVIQPIKTFNVKLTTAWINRAMTLSNIKPDEPTCLTVLSDVTWGYKSVADTGYLKKEWSALISIIFTTCLWTVSNLFYYSQLWSLLGVLSFITPCSEVYWE